MLLKQLYVISLERPEHWCLFFGTKIRGFKDKGIRVEYVRCYIDGLCGSADLISPESNDIEAFLVWLRDVRHAFPQRGWCAEYLEQSDDDHITAIQQFFGYLHEYLVETRPKWFIEFNRSPQPGLTRNAAGKGVSDIRCPDHIEAEDSGRGHSH